jgi:putative flavoprotein involved in K+ transport
MTLRPEYRDVVVVGGGQAGLAIGYHLKRQDLNFTILEAAGEPAAAWRKRWSSLRLFTPVRYDSLPGKPFPGDPDTYPSRDDVVAYLTEYAAQFELPVELSSPVSSVERVDDRYLVETNGRTYEADQVVMATGPFQVPFMPTIAADLSDAVVHFHSSEYSAPDTIPPGPVLVVGGGNTGFQIAAELTATHEVHLSIGSRQKPLPQRVLGRDLFTLLDRFGVMQKSADTRIGRRLKANEDTLIGSKPRALRRLGARLRPRAIEADGTTVSFDDGTSMTVSSVIWATGYRLDQSFVHAPVFDERGQVVHERGVTESPGLYFLGLPWQHTRGSALLGWVKDDAEYLAGRIRAHGAATTTSRPPAPATPDRIGDLT